MNISIIGGGITGLTTALALAKLGVQTTVYEQSKEVKEIGAGVLLQPNAVQVLDWLGIKDEVLQYGVPLNKMEISHPTLEPIKKINQDKIKDKFGNSMIAIHRGRLQKVLYNTFGQFGEVILGRKYISQSEKGDKIQVNFEDSSIETDMVLGADGIYSNVRAALFPKAATRDSKQTCWRGVAKLKLPSHLMYNGKEAWGKNRRFGLMNISESEVYWFAVANSDQYGKDLSREELKNMYAKFDPIVGQIIEDTEYIHTAQLEDLKRLDTWHSGKTCLLGDAAHATTPNMGQGACQGIEDAYYISNLLVQNKLSKAAFKVFESKRRAKVDQIVNTSWQFGQAAHSSFAQPLLKLMMKAMPESMLSKQMNKVFEIESF